MAAATKRPTVSGPEDKLKTFGSQLVGLDILKKGGTVEDAKAPLDVMPTGILGLDIATGVGGFPFGRMVEIYGQESAGKSTTVYHLIASAQRQGVFPFLIETEGSWDEVYTARIGVDSSKMVRFSPDSLEAAIDAITDSAELAKNMGVKALIVLDSVASIDPEVQMEASADRQFQSQRAAMWAAKMAKITRAVRASGCVLVLVNQMRDSRDLYKPPSTPGGRAIKYGASLRVLMRRKVVKAEKDSLSGALGLDVEYTIEKNKVGAPFRRGYAFFPSGLPVNRTLDVVDRAIERGLILSDQKLEDGEIIAKKNWFTLASSSEKVLQAIAEDLADAEAGGYAGQLPGTKGRPYLASEGPISVYYKKELEDLLAHAPRLTEALREAIYETIRAERSSLSEVNPFEEMILAASDRFDAEAEDGLTRADAVAAQVGADGDGDPNFEQWQAAEAEFHSVA